MSTAGNSHRFVFDYNGHYNNTQKRLYWKLTFNKFLENTMCALKELIDIREGCKECNSLINKI